MVSLCRRLWKKLNGRKIIKDENLEKSDLKRCLNTLDLTALGVGSTLGAGAYVIVGQVAKSETGPAIVLSFFIAAFASVLAGLCYAEFGARIPKAGSAYIFTYVSIGEFIAFIIGWNLILEYIIGAASIARAASGYLDASTNVGLVPWFNQTAQLNVGNFAEYCDFLAVGITLISTVILASGVKQSITLNKLFTGINLCIIIYIIIAGAFKLDPANWTIPEERVPNGTGICSKEGTCGVGGFMPFGVKGVIQGAANCFYAFIGFDAIAAAGEEVKNPQKAIPLATMLSLLIIFLVYAGVSTTITMMAPYFTLDENKPFTELFERLGWHVSKYFINAGVICALTTRYFHIAFLYMIIICLIGAMYPSPRIILAMGQDGLIFKIFGRINERLKTPIFATIFAGFLATFLAAIFDVDSLVEMMSLGTLMAYTLVATSAIILRYEPYPKNQPEIDRLGSNLHVTSYKIIAGRILKPDHKYPTDFSSKVVEKLVIFLIICITSMCLILRFCRDEIFHESSPALIGCFLALFLLTSGTICIIAIQPQNCEKLHFKVPLIEILPAISIAVNIFLMLNLMLIAWIRFLLWMAIGFLVYFGYGIRHSSNEEAKIDHVILYDHAQATGHVEDYCRKLTIGSQNPNCIVCETSGKHKTSINKQKNP